MKDINTKELFQRAHNGDKEAREQLILQNQLMVFKRAHYYKNTYNDFDTLVQVGNVGLMTAIDKYETERGFKFSTYAVPMIDGYIRAFLRDYREDRPFRPKRAEYELYREILKARTMLAKKNQCDPTISEIAIYLNKDMTEVEMLINGLENYTSIYSTKYRNGNSQDDILVIDSITDENMSEEQIINKMLINEALQVLTNKQREVIKLRYFEEYSQTKIGQVLNISQAQISRIEKRALELMREVI